MHHNGQNGVTQHEAHSDRENALNRMRAVLARVQADMAAWRDVPDDIRDLLRGFEVLLASTLVEITRVCDS